jgi:hypothetical protein
VITVERQSAIAGALLFSPLVALVVVHAWIYEPTASYGAVLTTLTAALALAFVLNTVLRPKRIEILYAPGAELVLEESREGADSTYRVLIEDRGQVRTLLDHDDPARALREVKRLHQELALPVRAGWGLSSTALSEARTPANLLPTEVRGARWQAQGRTALAACLGSLFIFGVTVFTFDKVSTPIGGLSRTLPTLSALLIALVGLALLTLRLRVRITKTGVTVDQTLLFFSHRTYEIEARSLFRADAVGASAAHPQHVVFHTAEGLRAVRLSGPSAQAVARAVVAEPPQPRQSGVSWAPAGRDHTISLEENPC